MRIPFDRRKRQLLRKPRIVSPTKHPGVDPTLGRELLKLYRNPFLTKEQVNTIRRITKDKLFGLKIGRKGETGVVWARFKDRHYIIIKSGKIIKEEKIISTPSPFAVSAVSKLSGMRYLDLSCPSCGTTNPVSLHNVYARCKVCGIPLTKVRIRKR